MSRLYLGNFSFEQGSDPAFQVPQTIRRFEAELASVWWSVAETGDAILCLDLIPESDRQRLNALAGQQIEVLHPEQVAPGRFCELVPWGWTQAARQLAARWKIPVSAPEDAIIWQANSRVTALEIARQLDCALPDETAIASLIELMPRLQAVCRTHSGWILKPEFGQAGRGHLRGKEPFLSEAQLATLIHLFSKGTRFTLEPLLLPMAEISGQWKIDVDGTAQLIGMTKLIADEQGRYRATGTNLVEIEAAARENIVQKQLQAVQILARQGYRGPVGIDAMLCREGSSVPIRPIQDINARWTMGRLGWEWGQRLRQQGTWVHASNVEGPALAMSPETVGGIPCRCRTWWVSGVGQ